METGHSRKTIASLLQTISVGGASLPSELDPSQEQVEAPQELQSKIKVLDHGHLELVAACASDLDVVNGARVSFNVWHEEMEGGDDKLIGYLLRERHGSPFEHTYFRFRVKAPLFVFREWHRHRVGHSYNEVSLRYTKIDPEFYIPERIRTRVGKPGSYNHVELDTANTVRFSMDIKATTTEARKNYLHALEAGVAPEMARMLLPVNTYSEMIWSCNARSLMHFLGLRNAPNAQWEIQQYAQAAESIFQKQMPFTHEAFVANGRVAP